ncbi:hypothetical protein HanPI659440_Chr12g0477971 [Helianthus annuus]|nr:hypothetical protein HanPI659440_Chr12g0477971 [Helianthus annuus]
MKNFALPKDADLNAQPSTDVGELMNLGVDPESKKKKRRPVASTISKKTDAPKADILKEEKKKGMHLVFEPWCDYVVVSNTLEGLVPVVVKQPKAEPRETADIPPSNPEEPIDLESSLEPLVRTKVVKRKKPEGEAAAQPATKILRKKLARRAILTPWLRNFPLVKKTMEVETKKAAEVETADAGVTKPKSPEVVAQGPEKEKFLNEEVPVISVPSSSAPASKLPTDDVQENPVHVEQGFVIHDEEEDSPIRPDETPGDYYYRTYSEKRASEIHVPVWKLKQGDTFSDWQVCRDWLQGTFRLKSNFKKNNPTSVPTTHTLKRPPVQLQQLTE